MSFLLRSAGKDLRRRLRDPLSLAFWVGIPVAIAGLLALIAGDDAGPPAAHVMVADHDDTFLSRLVAGGGGAGGPVVDVLRLEEVEPGEGRRRIDDGEATALLMIPEGFSDALLEGTSAELTLITNPSQRILPGIVREGVEMLAEASFYLRRLLGDQLDRMAAGPPRGEDVLADADVAAVAASVNARIRALGGVLFPPALVLEVETSGGEEEDDADGFGTLFLPGLLFMAILFIAHGVSDEVWTEKESGTLRRALLTPGGAVPFLAGKLLAGAAVCAGVAVGAVGAAVLFFDVSPGRLPLAVLWCTYAGTALLVYFLLIQLHASSQRGGYLVTTLLLFPLIMIGGSFFPFQAMPEWMAAVGRWTPNGLAVVRLQEIVLGSVDWSALGLSAAGIGAPALAAFLLAVRRLRHGFAVR